MASSSDSTEGKDDGNPPAKRPRYDDINMKTCWIATNACTGIPFDNQSTLLSEVRNDLEVAFAYTPDWWDSRPGEVKWCGIGRVTVTHTLFSKLP